MKLYLKLLFISMISFIYAECSEIDNQDGMNVLNGVNG